MKPLTKRLPRELKSGIGKYLGIFLLLVIIITLAASFLSVANNFSVVVKESREKFNVEDGRFSLDFQADKKTIEKIEDIDDGEVKVYELFSFDMPLTYIGTERTAGDTDFKIEGANARIYMNRGEVDLASYFEGQEPSRGDQIAIDRLFAAHYGIKVGDEVELSGKNYTVSGTLSLPDYQALMEDNNDLMMNTLTFTVAVVSKNAFAALEEDEDNSETFTYAFTFKDRNMSLADRTDLDEKIADVLVDEGEIVDELIDYESNQGISFISEDIESDTVMWKVLIALLIVIMAFVFIVITSSTIEEESAIIGTLLANGYRKSEIVRHYLILPAFVGLIGCAVGNVIGYTLMLEPMRAVYYNSYSLPPCDFVFDWNVFLITTVVPYVLLVVITWIGLSCKLSYRPLQFLRHEITRSKSRGSGKVRGSKIPEGMRFISRFRLRVFLRNIPAFITLFIGICFGSMLLLFSLCIQPSVDSTSEGMAKDLVSEHMYMLKACLEIDVSKEERKAWEAAEELASLGDYEIDEIKKYDPDILTELYADASEIDEDHPINTKENSKEAISQAEKFAAYKLNVARRLAESDEVVTIYGIKENSAYWSDLDVSEGRIVVGNGLLQKCEVELGKPAEYKDGYTNKTYNLVADAAYGSDTNMYVYMSLETFNNLFDNDSDYFNGYVSNEKLALDARYLASDITPESMYKLANQIESTMADMLLMFVLCSILIYIVLMYLLTKTVIDRARRAISYMKVFGYSNREVNRIYITSITIVTIISLIVSIPLVIWLVSNLVELAMGSYSGNIVISMPILVLVEILIAGIFSYAIVAIFHIRRIRKVPLSIALKVQE